MSQAAVAGSSPFGALLRRSKFATYDPKIAQVYTSYGGHAHRGDWGIKRPLAKQRRGFYAKISAIDTNYEHTEWIGASKEAKWMKIWEEMNVVPKVSTVGSWRRHWNHSEILSWEMDSDVSMPSTMSWPEVNPRISQEKEPLIETLDREDRLHYNQVPVRNINSMTPPEFERYLKKIQSLHPAFKAFEKAQHPELQKSGKNRNLIPTYLKFLASISEESNPKSSRIDSQAHHNGGLTYAPVPRRTYVPPSVNQPLPGRVLRLSDPVKGHYDAAVGGIVTETAFPWAYNEKITSLDLGNETGKRDPHRGKYDFRITNVVLSGVPSTVGQKPTGIGALYMQTSSREVTTLVTKKQKLDGLPPRPGSRAYVDHMPIKRVATNNALPDTSSSPSSSSRYSSIMNRKRAQSRLSTGDRSTDLLSKLRQIVEDIDKNR